MTPPETIHTPTPNPPGQALSGSARRVQDALAKLGFTLAVVELPHSTRTAPAAAAAVGAGVGQIVKSLIFRGANSGRAILVLASASNRSRADACLRALLI